VPGNVDAFTVSLGTDTAVSAVAYLARDPSVAATLILGHGAGANQRSPFMVAFSEALQSRGVDVVTFNFPYTEQRRRVPDKPAVLEACYRAVTAAVHARVHSAGHALFTGGKSMGGRIATQVAAADHDTPIAGLVLLGYPLHPPGRPDKRRDAHLKDVRRPMLIVQGSRDVFGTPSELAPILDNLPVSATLHVVEGGDHSFAVSRSDRTAQAAVFEQIQDTIVRWMKALISRAPESRPPAG